jgi:methylphosphotriester-DNA--protein-cysteine methyltransferase
MDRHRVWFRSLDAAADAGYRPCKVCRPASGAASIALAAPA